MESLRGTRPGRSHSWWKHSFITPRKYARKKKNRGCENSIPMFRYKKGRWYALNVIFLNDLRLTDESYAYILEVFLKKLLLGSPYFMMVEIQGRPRSGWSGLFWRPCNAEQTKYLHNHFSKKLNQFVLVF